MDNEQLVMIDLEKGTPSDSDPITEAHPADQSDIPIKSENCAASLSLADAHLVTKDGNIASAETTFNHLGQKSDRAAVPRALSRRSSLCWGICLLTTSVAILLSILGTIAREDFATPIAHPELNDVIDYLLSHNISSHKDLTSEKSPRHLAARWLVETDPAELPLPLHYDYLYVTRYVMALNYFALNGDDWTVKVNFMTGKHVCHWNDAKHAYGSKGVETGGLLCGDSGMPEVLDLGKFCREMHFF
ncbi:hypothetical protein FisN_25Hu129 [Fistulifera solaris]|uniref:Uncharacterized protein n=1 Tax=Fistulifera solaris TaxID=1519565 RepID=A0A1Z5JVT3_FISSO|nr:hypothetical protein FisN_25Hu129 [Fistulifera solaris]|eukprot:GAX18147.1 hypothetical protein FisN_25Hu129 [Fistulifera solaris]